MPDYLWMAEDGMKMQVRLTVPKSGCGEQQRSKNC